MNIIKRIQRSLVKEHLKKSTIVAILGARQVGKTTLVEKLLGEDRDFYTFDDPALVSIAQSNPRSFLTQANKITLDEVQKCPAILSSLKRIVDEEKVPGRFLITGSANITMLPKISETLAGRITFVDIFPLTIFEICSFNENPIAIDILSCNNYNDCWNLLNKNNGREIPLEKFAFRGGLPPAWIENDDAARIRWFEGYVRTYLERDVRDLSQVRRLYDFKKFLSLMAFRAGQIFNMANISREAGIPYTTAVHFFDLLLATFQIFLLEPYFSNIGKRLTKAPKLIWNDTGIATYLQGLTKWEDAEKLGRAPFIIENKIAAEIKTLLSVYLPQAKLYYWRTSAGAEIDLLVEHGDQLIPIEIKWSENVIPKSTISMQFFLKDFEKKAPWGIILYKGENLLKLKENIFLVPFNRFLG